MQDILIISMNVKCPKKTNRWVHLEHLLAFYKQYRCKLINYTKENCPEMLSTDEWWVVTYSVSPAIDLINITFTLLQSKLLLLAQ
jgi:lipase chaperone LimK